MYTRYLSLEIEQGQSIFLWGARKTGKSTYLKHQFPKSIYIDLLKTDICFKYTVKPSLLREEIMALPDKQLALPIIIDEVQKVPMLLDEIHYLIEHINATFILCGSSARKLKQQGTNLLGGRAIKYNFYPLIYPEIKNDFDLLKILNQGTIPSHFLSRNARKLLQAYVEDYLTNEVRNEGYVRNITAFSRFLDSTKFSNGEMINYSNIAREVGIDAKTIKEYYQILVDTLVGYLIYPYAKKIQRSVIARIPKFYYFDVGIACRIAKTTINELVGPDTGKFLEHYILMELKAYIGLNDLDHDLFYWRTNTGFEVDFILSDGNNIPIPIEVKISQNIHKTELKSLKAFIKEHNVNMGYIICQEQSVRKIEIDENSAIFILPIKIFLDKLWNHEIIPN